MLKDVFVPTRNFDAVVGARRDLLGYQHDAGIVLASGRTGRGKSTIMQRLAATDQSVVYLPFQQWLSPSGVLRELCFSLCGRRPFSGASCFDQLKISFSEKRYVVVIDEADLMSLKHVNALRNLYDNLGIGLLLVGEESLRGLVGRERRILSRVSREIAFEPVGVPDITFFYQKSLDLALSASHAAELAKHAQGDFRTVRNDARAMDRIMQASGISNISDELVKEICK